MEDLLINVIKKSSRARRTDIVNAVGFGPGDNRNVEELLLMEADGNEDQEELMREPDTNENTDEKLLEKKQNFLSVKSLKHACTY